MKLTEKMSNHKEEKWVENLCKCIRENEAFIEFSNHNEDYEIFNSFRLPYAINLNNTLVKDPDKRTKYNVAFDKNPKVSSYNVDIAIVKKNSDGTITPKLIIETKYKNINTHDPITYSYKASLHKNLFRGLRYGLVVGNYKKRNDEGIKERDDDQCYIPIRVIEHGESFDFIFFMKEDYSKEEISALVKTIIKNVQIADKLENFGYKDEKYLYVEKNINFEK